VVGDTLGGAGTASITTNPGALTLTTTANQAYYDTVAPTATIAQEIWSWFSMRQVTGGGISGAVIALDIRHAVVGTGYNFRVHFSATQIRLRDVYGAADVATVDADVAGGVELFVATGSGVVSIWYRELGSDEDGDWSVLASAVALTDDAGAGGTTNRIRYGNIASGTAESRWYLRGWGAGTTLGGSTYHAQMAAGQSNPADLWPGDYTVEPRYFADGCMVGATGGPGARDDQYTIPASARYPYRYLLPVAARGSAWKIRGGMATSPRSIWRSTSPSGRVAFRFPEAAGGASGETRSFVRGLLLLQLENSNVGSVIVQTTNDATSVVWDTLYTATLGLTGLPFRRRGSVIYPNPAGTFTTEPVIDWGEYVGGYVDLGSGQIGKIVWNSGGRWSADGTSSIPEIHLETDSSQDGAVNPLWATSGTMTLRAPRSTIAVYLDGTKEYTGIALYWSSSQDTAEDDAIQIGIAAPCLGVVLGDEYTRGRTDGVINGDVLLELDNGVRVVSSKKGPRRVSALPYADVHQEDTRRADDPIYYKLTSTSGAPAVAERGDADNFLRDLLGRRGPKDPILYVPALAINEGAGSDNQVLLGYRSGIYGRVVTQEYTPRNELGNDVLPSRRLITWSIEEEL
jgi:hypothetical protein